MPIESQRNFEKTPENNITRKLKCLIARDTHTLLQQNRTNKFLGGGRVLQQNRTNKFWGERGRGKKVPLDTVVNKEILQEEQ